METIGGLGVLFLIGSLLIGNPVGAPISAAVVVVAFLLNKLGIR